MQIERAFVIFSAVFFCSSFFNFICEDKWPCDVLTNPRKAVVQQSLLSYAAARDDVDVTDKQAVNRWYSSALNDKSKIMGPMKVRNKKL